MSKNLLGPKAKRWKGGWKHAAGYIVEGSTLQHRRVMQDHLGRKLKCREHVHHINGVKTDNRLENLEVMDWKKHGKIHGKQHGKNFVKITL